MAHRILIAGSRFRIFSAPDYCSNSELKRHDRHFWMCHSHQLLRDSMCSKYDARRAVCFCLYDQICSPTSFFSGSASTVSSLSFTNSCISHTLFQLFFLDSSHFCFPSLYSTSLPSSFCLHTPSFSSSSSSPPVSPLRSWQWCQSGLADRGKHSTGQSRGRSKGWPIDYVCVCSLTRPPARLLLPVCPCA